MIAAGKLALDPVDFSLSSAITDATRALAGRAQRKGLELTSHVQLDVPDGLIGDVGRLRQVLMNLVGNALKFTGQGKVEVEVRLARDEMPDDSLCLLFEVRDTGIGIAREKQADIFRAFEQADASTTRKYGGTGLGLTISSQLVALMGGEITVESEPGQGSTFGFTARFGRSSRVEFGAPVTSAGSPSDEPALVVHRNEAAWRRLPTVGARRTLRFLVAEDNELNVSLLRELLSHGGHRARFASDGRAALTLVASGPFDVLLLDLHMPEMDGFEVVRIIRENERTTGKHLPIIALTARSSSRDRGRCSLPGWTISSRSPSRLTRSGRPSIE
jgi:CheY-like chemotaxis protein